MSKIKTFIATFDNNLSAVVEAERITRELLREMSRDLLLTLHNDVDDAEENNPRVGDISFANKLLSANITPVNKKAMVLFLREFTGFNFDEDTIEFKGKNKQHYAKARDKAIKALEDPHFNFWSWADRNVEVAKKPFKLADITKNVERMLKKADEAGLAKADVIAAILEGGIELGDIVAILDAAE